MITFNNIEERDGVLTALVIDNTEGKRESITVKTDGSYHSSKDEIIVKATWELLKSVLTAGKKRELLSKVFQEEYLIHLLVQKGFDDSDIKVIKTYSKDGNSEPSGDVFCNGVALSFYYGNNGTPYTRYTGEIRRGGNTSSNVNLALSKAEVILDKMQELVDSYRNSL